VEIDETVARRLEQALQALEFLADSQEGQAAISQEAAALRLLLQSPRARAAKPEPTDPRILQVAGGVRLVAPALRDSSDRRRYLNGKLLVETARKDSLGATCWQTVRALEWSNALGALSTDNALIVLLVDGRGFADRDLYEFQKG